MIKIEKQKGMPNQPVLVSCVFSRNTPSIFSWLTQHFRGTTCSAGVIKPYQNRCRGAVLLISILVSSVVLSVGLGVYNRTYKELVFASFWKQAQTAFSAADSGLECAIYWDTHQASATSASCFAATVPGWNPSSNLTTTFSISTPVCVTVEITKNAAYPFTTIRSRGYNTCTVTDPRRVERGLRIDY